VRTATAGGYNGSTKYLGEDIEEAKKHYFGLIGSNIDIHLDGIMVYEDDNYDCWDILKPTPQGDICCNPKCNEKLSDQDDQLCHTCYHKSCEDGECYCDIMKPTPQGN